MKPPCVAEVSLEVLEKRDPHPFSRDFVPHPTEAAEPANPAGRLFVLRGDPDITDWDSQVCNDGLDVSAA